MAMIIRVKRLSPVRTGIMVAVVNILWTALILIPWLLIATLFFGRSGGPIVQAVLGLVVFGVPGGFIVGVIGAALYNVAAGSFGGFRLEVEVESPRD